MIRLFALTALTLGLITPLAADNDVFLMIYDVTDLVKRTPDFPAPKLGIASNDEESTGGTILTFEDEEDEGRDIVNHENDVPAGCERGIVVVSPPECHI